MATGTNPFSLQFSNVETFGAGINPLDITTGDFNGDGILDLATVNNGSDNISVLLGAGNGTFGTATSIAVGSNPDAVTSADFNGDGRLDLAVANRGNNTVSLLLGAGTGAFTAGGTIAVGTQPVAVITADFNGDRLADLATVSANQNLVTILLNNGTGGFGIPTNFAIGVNPTSIVTGDFNGDGRLDLVTANALVNSPTPTPPNTNAITIALGQGDGSFIPGASFGTGTDPFSLTAGDFNGDGRLDIATANSGSNNISVLLGTGTGGFGTAAAIALGTGITEPYTIASRDVNGDGKLDLITANSGSNNLSVLLGKGDGTFTVTAPLLLAGRALPNGLAIGDFNGDGKPDLATANYANARASVFLNRTSLISLNDSTKTIDASLERSASITVDLTAGTLVLNSTPPANANVTGYLNVLGTELGDTIAGNAEANNLDGKGGNDTITGGAGNDTITGGAGNDGLNGGDSNDRYLFAANTPLGSDTITDPTGTDTLDFSATTLPIAVNLGVTVAQTVNPNLTLTLTAANQIENVTGGSGSDFVSGNGLNNFLVGGAGDDQMNAQTGDDTLLGDSGNDIVIGAAGDDDLTGGMGNDILRGGVGEDLFIFDIGKAFRFNKAEMGLDTVRDFKRGIDRFVLDRTTFTELGRRFTFASVDRLIQAKRSDARITYIRSTGSLYYNANGSELGFGGGGLFAVLDKPNLPSRDLTAADFSVRS